MAQRIISLAPSNTEILFELGVQDRLVAVTTLCSHPDAARALPKVGSWIRVHDMAQFDRLKPDLILASMFVPDAVREWSEKHGVELVNLYPQTLEGIYDSVMHVGELTSSLPRAREIVLRMQAEISAARWCDDGERLRVYSEEYHNPPTVAANWVPELIEAAGGIALSRSGVLSYEVSARDVADFDPDVIVLHWCGFGPHSRVEDLLERREWQDIRAVKQGSIVAVDDMFLNRPGPRITRGVPLLRACLERFSASRARSSLR